MNRSLLLYVSSVHFLYFLFQSLVWPTHLHQKISKKFYSSRANTISKYHSKANMVHDNRNHKEQCQGKVRHRGESCFPWVLYPPHPKIHISVWILEFQSFILPTNVALCTVFPCKFCTLLHFFTSGKVHFVTG